LAGAPSQTTLAGGAHIALPDPQLDLKSPTSKAREGIGRVGDQVKGKGGMIN